MNENNKDKVATGISFKRNKLDETDNRLCDLFMGCSNRSSLILDLLHVFMQEHNIDVDDIESSQHLTYLVMKAKFKD